MYICTYVYCGMTLCDITPLYIHHLCHVTRVPAGHLAADCGVWSDRRWQVHPLPSHAQLRSEDGKETAVCGPGHWAGDQATPATLCVVRWICATCTSPRTTHSCSALDMYCVSVVSVKCLDCTSLHATVCSIVHMCLWYLVHVHWSYYTHLLCDVMCT